MGYTNGVFIALAVVAGFSTSSMAAENKERWFDVEVIVFKNKRSNLSEEIWPEKAPLIFPDNIKDFITAALYPAPEGAEDLTNKTSDDSKTTNQQAQSEDSESFVLMPQEQLQLTNLYGSINRSSWYEPLAHVAWRQPVKDKGAAEWVRIVGGKNYIDEFDFKGHEKENTEGLNLQSTSLVSEAFNEFGEPIVKPYQPVPEVDGALQVYLGRYLHINTDLVIRIPGEEELDITAISNSLSSSMLELTNDGVMNEEYESSFDWSFQSDNWLDPEKQTTRVKRLLNYPMSQSRRIRSGEVHYFDHPLYGIIIQIRPYEKDNSSNETSAGR